MLIDHHNAIKRQLSSGSDIVGIIDDKLNPFEAIEDMIEDVRSCCESNFGVSPKIVLDGSHKEFQFSYVRDHVERIMYAILLNASRATAQYHIANNNDEELPDVRVLVAGDETGCTIRVNDERCSLSRQRTHPLRAELLVNLAVGVAEQWEAKAVLVIEFLLPIHRISADSHS